MNPHRQQFAPEVQRPGETHLPELPALPDQP